MSTYITCRARRVQHDTSKIEHPFMSFVRLPQSRMNHTTVFHHELLYITSQPLHVPLNLGGAQWAGRACTSSIWLRSAILQIYNIVCLGFAPVLIRKK